MADFIDYRQPEGAPANHVHSINPISDRANDGRDMTRLVSRGIWLAAITNLRVILFVTTISTR